MSEIHKLVTTGVTKNRMKERMAKNTRLTKEGVQVVSDTVNHVFDNIVAELSKMPYRDYTGYVCKQQCDKYLVKSESESKLKIMIREMHDTLRLWLDKLEALP